MGDVSDVTSETNGRGKKFLTFQLEVEEERSSQGKQSSPVWEGIKETGLLESLIGIVEGETTIMSSLKAATQGKKRRGNAEASGGFELGWKAVLAC